MVSSKDADDRDQKHESYGQDVDSHGEPARYTGRHLNCDDIIVKQLVTSTDKILLSIEGSDC